MSKTSIFNGLEEYGNSNYQGNGNYKTEPCFSGHGITVTTISHYRYRKYWRSTEAELRLPQFQVE